MIEQTLRSFCESRHRWLIVIAGTVAVGLVLVVPLVDAYTAEREEKASLLAELESANQIAEMLAKFEGRVAEKSALLAKFDARTVTNEEMPALRTKLVDMAREAGCSLRRLSVGDVSSRPWHEGDNPIESEVHAIGLPVREPSGVLLQSWPVSVSLSGGDGNLRNMLDRMEADGMLMHTKSLEMHPASASRKMLELDMELWYFNVVRGS